MRCPAIPKLIPIFTCGVLLAACNDASREQAAPAAVPVKPEAPVTAPAAEAAPAPKVATRAAAEQAIAWLSSVAREPAGDASNPWALAHGLLAFGKDFQTRDGRGAVAVAASFAEKREQDGKARYGFPPERAGMPVEPHPYLLVKTFLQVGVDPMQSFVASDAKTITLRHLLDDMRASAAEPSTDGEWQQAAWWIDATEQDLLTRKGKTPTPRMPVERMREAALARLELDDQVIMPEPTANAFDADMPMGAAKRAKSQIYGHPCGGLHFVQAVLRSAAASGSPAYLTRVQTQLRLLLARYDAERALYATTLRAHPSAALVISEQQMKFFGHLLETLALADQLQLLAHDTELAAAVQRVRVQASADLLQAVGTLQAVHAYDHLAELSSKQHQVFLDLIGDGCHAIHGLNATLAALPAS